MDMGETSSAEQNWAKQKEKLYKNKNKSTGYVWDMKHDYCGTNAK